MTEARSLTVDAGPRVNRVLPNTHYRAQQARAQLDSQVEALAGRSYTGETSVHLTWKDGQIVRVIQKVDAVTI